MLQPSPRTPRKPPKPVPSWWDRAGEEFWTALGKPEGPADPIALLRHVGVTVNLYDGPSHLHPTEDVVYLDQRVSVPQMNFAASHELGHWLLRCKGWSDNERRASYMGAWVVMPDEWAGVVFEQSWKVVSLREEWGIELSLEALVRRLISVQPVRATIFDNGEFLCTLHSRGARDESGCSALERELADAVGDADELVFEDKRLVVCAVGGPDTRRVVTLVHEDLVERSKAFLP